MKTLRYLLQKEFKQIFRNPMILRLIILIPIIQLLILPLVADYEIKNIDISVVDQDRSTYSRELIDKITASGYFTLNDYTNDFRTSFETFEKDKSDLILEIPQHFEKDLVNNQESSLFLAVNAINGTKAMLGSNYLSRIIGNYNQEVREKWMLQPKINPLPVVEVVSANWFNPFLSYPVFMVPGILVLLVTMVGTYMCALNIVKEKEVGTIEQINVSPIKKHHFILGKMIPFWVIGIFVFSLGLFGVGRLVYHIIPLGSMVALYTFLAVYMVAVLGIGLIVSTYSQSQQQAMSLAFFLMMIFVLMGGLFTSIESMPTWAQWIAFANPVSHFIEVVRLIVLKGSGFAEIKNQFVIMGGMAIFFNGWAVLNYRKRS
ncbi:MAG: ABC transporter permease [Saprospiraceae bacterium]